MLDLNCLMRGLFIFPFLLGFLFHFVLCLSGLLYLVLEFGASNSTGDKCGLSLTDCNINPCQQGDPAHHAWAL